MSDLSTLSGFLSAYPWPDALTGGRRTLDALWYIDVPLAVTDLWPQIVDTSRVNRAVGLEPMELVERAGALEGATVYGKLFPHRWREAPWTWVWCRELQMVRHFSQGFGTAMRGIILFRETPGGTRLIVYFGWVPKGPLRRLALAMGMRDLERGYRKAVARIVAAGVTAPTLREPVLTAPAPPLAAGANAQLDDLADRLAREPVAAAAVERLIEHVRGGDPLDLHRIRPIPLARLWGLDTRDVLTACLYATRVGLLDLRWDVICPHCRGVRTRVDRLFEIPREGRCEACEVDFETRSEEALEVTFRVHPSIRRVDEVAYCSAEPARRSHIKVQQRLEPGESRRFEVRLPPGAHRIRTRSGHHVPWHVRADGAPATVAWPPGEADGPIESGPVCEIDLANPGPEVMDFAVEEAGWGDEALRARHLFGLQDFRDLFSEEYLAADIQIAVGRQTLLFTDIVGSTEFYERRGDPEAFIEVKRHFQEIYEEVTGHDGAVVKTIGDSVMASFSRAVEALAAARAIQARLHAGRDDTSIRVRISLNTGPCIAVNLNNGVDFFGSAVNLAAKLQACAGAGQVAFSAAVRESPGVESWLSEHGIEIETTSLEHPAFGAGIPVLRFTV